MENRNSLFITNILNACDTYNQILDELNQTKNIFKFKEKKRLKENKQKIIDSIESIRDTEVSSEWIDDLMISLIANRYRLRKLLSDHTLRLDMSSNNVTPSTLAFLDGTDIIVISVISSSIIMHINHPNNTKESIQGTNVENGEQRPYFISLKNILCEMLYDYLEKKY